MYGEFFGGTGKGQLRRAEKVEFGKIDRLEVFAVYGALIVFHLPAGQGDECCSLQGSGAGVCLELIYPDMIFVQVRRELNVLQMNTGGGQIGAGPGQVQLSGKLRVFPGPGDGKVGIKFPGTLLDKAREKCCNQTLSWNFPEREARTAPLGLSDGGKRAASGNW